MKAWCYYESRILGSHHGLLSTYALTVLLMYIFNVCYDDIDSPLRALYFVLNYFSQFDWDTHAISINGPVLLPSLPSLQGWLFTDQIQNVQFFADIATIASFQYDVRCNRLFQVE